MNMHTIRSRLACATTTMLLALAADASVTILGKPQQGTFATIQAAIDAASHGDVLLIGAGTYNAGFVIDDKALTLLGQGIVNVKGKAVVKNLAQPREVTLLSLAIAPPNSSVAPTTLHALETLACAGLVRVQNCKLNGAAYLNSFPNPADTCGHALRAVDCDRLVVVDSQLTGGGGFISLGGTPPRDAGDGLFASNSAVAVWDSKLQGNEGMYESNPSGCRGGNGAHVTGKGVFLSGCLVRGGDGGGGDFIGCTTSGDGGHGLLLDAGIVHDLANQFSGGSGVDFNTCGVGANGDPQHVNGGLVANHAGAARLLDAPDVVTDNASVPLAIRGEPGDAVWLLKSTRSSFLSKPIFVGIALVPQPWLLSVTPLGTIGASGQLTHNLVLGDLSGAAGYLWNLQAVAIPLASEHPHLSTPRKLVILDT